MSTLPGALEPFAPFGEPVPLPVPGPFDAPLVCLQVNETWMIYILGCVQALLADSTWDSDDENAVATVKQNARNLIGAMQNLEACPMPVQFRVNPTDPHFWDYSTDGGTTWTRQPDTVTPWQPTFTVDGSAPGGYDLSVNGGLSSAPIPNLTATDPDAVVTDPGTLLRNLITAGAGADGLAIQALAQIGVALMQNNGIAAYFAKIPGLGLAQNAVVQIAGGTDYTYPLIEVP